MAGPSFFGILEDRISGPMSLCNCACQNVSPTDNAFVTKPYFVMQQVRLILHSILHVYYILHIILCNKQKIIMRGLKD